MLRHIYNWLIKVPTGRYAAEIKNHLSEQEWNQLVDLAKNAQGRDYTLRAINKTILSLPTSQAGLDKLRDNIAELRSIPEMGALLNPEAILENPMVTPYRRSAFRLLPEYLRDLLQFTPIVVTPSFRYEPFATKFAFSERAFIQIPFGLISFSLRCVAQVAYGLTVSEPRSKDYQDYARALAVLVKELDSPPLDLYVKVYEILGATRFRFPSLFAVQCAQFMGVFVLLHELGHVAMEHWIPKSMQALGDEAVTKLRNQEFAADEFAIRCILQSYGVEKIEWNHGKDGFCFYICLCLLAFHAHFRARKFVAPSYYPGFDMRCLALLESVDAPNSLREKVNQVSELFAVASIH